MLNGEFIFFMGTLDQGFWPDGLYTPPTLEAMKYDLQVLKKLGYNGLRKHVSNVYRSTGSVYLLTDGQIKVEMDLFYQACDEMGLMLIQDMPSLRPSQTLTTPNCTIETILPDPAQQAEFQRQLEVMVKQHRNYPSIVFWVCNSQ